VDIFLPVYVSLLVILVCITTAILYSMYTTRGKGAGQHSGDSKRVEQAMGPNDGPG